jgi:hypothetical protein
MEAKRGRGRAKGFKMPVEHRGKIQQSVILNRLSKLVAGEIDMPPHAVTAALGLLRKVLPDLASQELTIDHVQPFAVLPAVMPDSKDWEVAFQPNSKPDTEH